MPTFFALLAILEVPKVSHNLSGFLTYDVKRILYISHVCTSTHIRSQLACLRHAKLPYFRPWQRPSHKVVLAKPLREASPEKKWIWDSTMNTAYGKPSRISRLPAFSVTSTTNDVSYQGNQELRIHDDTHWTRKQILYKMYFKTYYILSRYPG